MCCKPLQYSKQKMNEKVDGYLAGSASGVGAGPGDPGRLVHRRGRSRFVTSRCGRLLLQHLGHAIGRQQGGRRHDPDVIMLVQPIDLGSCEGKRKDGNGREWGEKKGGGGYAATADGWPCAAGRGMTLGRPRMKAGRNGLYALWKQRGGH
jgi:hypothetical protein